jgi:hypothetical protein
MDENRPQSVFGTSSDEVEQENRRRQAKAQVRTLTEEEYREQLRALLEDELRKTPEQRAQERQEWWEKLTEKKRKRREQFLKPRRPKWP